MTTNKMENFVTSLELSKKLKEAGVVQKSELYYMRADNKYTKVSEYGDLKYGLTGYYGLNTEPYVLGKAGYVGLIHCIDYCSAFLSDELLMMLPKQIKLKNTTFYFEQCYSGKGNPRIAYRGLIPISPDGEEDDDLHIEVDAREVQARGSMLLYLIEHKIINVEDLRI